MTLDLPVILLFIVGAFAYSLTPSQWRGWLILIISVIGVYVFQPFLPIRFSDFILPTFTLTLVLAGWWFSRPKTDPVTRDDRAALAVIGALILGLALMRFVEEDYRASRPRARLIR